MKGLKSTVIIFILQFIFCFAQAEEFRYTVIAEHGLSVRVEPNLVSEIITTLPFGALVHSENYGIYDKLDTIDGEIGFWLKIRHKDISGFMFSGYLISGDAFPLSRIDTIPFIIIDEWAQYSEKGKYSLGFYDPFRYSPNMYWYGIKVLDSTTIITKTNVVPEYNPNRWDQSDTIMFDVKLKVDNQENFDFVFGSKIEFTPSEIKSKKYFDLNSKIGLFIYPEQCQRIFPEINGYRLCGSENITDGRRTDEQIKRTYALELLYWKDTVTVINFDKIFNLQESARRHAQYRNPQLYWSGDINNDGHPDMIIKHNPMSEVYVMRSLHFVISQERNGKIEFYTTSTYLDYQIKE